MKYLTKRIRTILLFVTMATIMLSNLVYADTKVPHIFGKTYSEMEVQWWQWIDSNEWAPVLAEGEVDCMSSRQGRVVFLAGTAGGSAERSCTIRPGMYLLFPLVNATYINFNDGTDIDCPDGPLGGPCTVEEKRMILDGLFTENTCGLFAKVDGVPVHYDGLIVRNQTQPFSFAGDDKAVSDGYWVLLPPLPRGEHTVSFGGGIFCDAGVPGFSVDVTYNITVGRYRYHYH